MKRRLTLAFGCLACAVPSITSASSSPLRPAQVAAVESRRLTLLGATQVAQRELERRGLAGGHSIASVVLLPGVTPDAGHFDVRIDPPARLADGVRLRGFAVGIDGAIFPVTGFRAAFQTAGQDVASTAKDELSGETNFSAVPSPVATPAAPGHDAQATNFSGPTTSAGEPDAPISTP